MFPYPESASSSSGLDDRDDSDKDKCNMIVKWCQWENITLEDGKESLEKTSKRSPAIELYEALIEMLPGFLEHHYIKRRQSESYNLTST